MATEPTDQDLVASARGGDRAALERLLERHQRRVYRFGIKMCRDPEEAKDVLQETLLAAARTLPEFRPARRRRLPVVRGAPAVLSPGQPRP